MSEAIYFDITTNSLNLPNTNVTGTKSDFNIPVSELTLKSTDYLISVTDFRYPTVDLQAAEGLSKKKAESVQVIVSCSAAETISVNGRAGPFLYKSQKGSSTAESADFHTDIIDSSVAITPKISSAIINSINIQLVRSDNGQPYPFTDTADEPSVFITLKIQPISQHFSKPMARMETGALNGPPAVGRNPYH